MTEQDLRRIAAESMVDPRTVRKWASGAKVTEATRMRILWAATKLKIRIEGKSHVGR